MDACGRAHWSGSSAVWAWGTSPSRPRGVLLTAHLRQFKNQVNA